MKFKLFLIICTLTLISCDEEHVDNSSNWDFDNKSIHLEFVLSEEDQQNTTKAKRIIERVRKEIYHGNDGYFLGKVDNDWQGIQKININRVLQEDEFDESYPVIHFFNDIKGYPGVQPYGFEKVIITYKPNKAPTFDHAVYKLVGELDGIQAQQRVSNAGNFTYNQKEDPTEEEIAAWMIEVIVLLSFK